MVAATAASSGFVIALWQPDSVRGNISCHKVCSQRGRLSHFRQTMQWEKKQNDRAEVYGKRDRLGRSERGVFLPDFSEYRQRGRGLQWRHLGAVHSNGRKPKPFL
jgi:hypothetical protein